MPSFEHCSLTAKVHTSEFKCEGFFFFFFVTSPKSTMGTVFSGARQGHVKLLPICWNTGPEIQLAASCNLKSRLLRNKLKLNSCKYSQHGKEGFKVFLLLHFPLCVFQGQEAARCVVTDKKQLCYRSHDQTDNSEG